MGTTGLIFGAIVAAWLAYLVPMYLKKHQAATSATDPETRFSESVQIVQSSADDDPGEGRVSTPPTREAAISAIRRAEQQAAGRRRNVILVLGSVLALFTVLAGVGVTPWWLLAIPGGLLVAFLAVARFSVQTMHQNFEERLDRIERGCDQDTVTVAEEVTLTGDKGRKRPTGGKSRVEEVELGAPVGEPGALWDPLPITRPTYVSAPPVSGRTVRTIDLTEPIMMPTDTPVIADAPELRPVAMLRAVGY